MYVSKMLQHRFKKRKEENNFDHQAEYYKNIWNYCKKVLEPETEKVKSNFSKTDCAHYFGNTLKLENRYKRFTSPSWMKDLKILQLILTCSHLIKRKSQRSSWKWNRQHHLAPLIKSVLLLLRNILSYVCVWEIFSRQPGLQRHFLMYGNLGSQY